MVVTEFSFSPFHLIGDERDFEFQRWRLIQENFSKQGSVLTNIRFAAEDVGGNVRGRSALIFEQIVFRDEEFAQAEIRDRDAVGALMQNQIPQFQIPVDDVSL